MFTIAICDDDLGFAKRLNKSIKKGFERKDVHCIIDIFDDAETLTRYLEQKYYDIICLDIKIGAVNGIDIGNHIRDVLGNQKSQIVYISSYDSYHRERKLYASSPMEFIHKPFNDSDIDRIVSRAITRILPKQKSDDYFTFVYDWSKSSVLKGDIVYVSCNGRQKTIHTVDKDYQINSNIKKIIQDINSPDFVMVHRSYLVNVPFIARLMQTGLIENIKPPAMLVRVEQAEASRMIKNASNGKMIKVSQTEIITKGGGPNGRFQFITHKMEMPVPHSVHPQI